MSRAAALVAVLAAALGALLGEALWRGAVEARSSAPPPDWTADGPDVPRRLGSLMGPAPADPNSWSLDFWRTLWPEDPHLRSGPAPIRATVLLPEDGQVELWVSLPRGQNPAGGVALVLERVGEPTALVVQQQRNGRRELPCSRELPPPGSAAMPVRIEPLPNGVVAEVGGVEVRCHASLPQAGPALRSGLRRVRLGVLEVGEVASPPPGPPLRPLWWLGCAALVALVVGAELGLGARPALVAWTTAPLLLSAPLLTVDARAFVETARLPWLEPHWLAAGAPAALAVAAKATHALGRMLVEQPDPDGLAPRDWPWAAPLAASVPAALALAASPGTWPGPVAAAVGLVGGLAVAGVSVPLLGALGSTTPRRSATIAVAAGAAVAAGLGLLNPLHRVAVSAAGLGGLAWGALVWANANAGRVRAYNLVCLGLIAGVIAATEGAVRYTAAGVAWSGAGSRTRPDDIYGWVPAANESFALLEAGEHTTYPDRGFPVAAPASSDRPRVVAMGGSTTGGAFQNDDLGEFYPALLDGLLGGRVEVLNQGVGGWTTWHIRRYLEDHLDRLDPDVVTLYVGHNDLLTPAPMPYAELYAAWQGAGRGRRVSDTLGRLRLYQALRYGLAATRSPGRRVAVPVEDARENLDAIARSVTARGGRVVLASEGLAPDPGPLAGYNRMMEALAARQHGVSFVPLAERLHSWNGARVFIDDCHLTETGHRLVAEGFARELERLGVVEDTRAP